MTDDRETAAGADDTAAEATLFPKKVGEQLREARLAKKLELTELAQRTRVPLRHLQAIEDGDYSGLPTPTYAIGFAKSYARAVGLDEVEVARAVRGGAEASAARRPEYQPYVTDEPPRTPSNGVMLGAVALAVLLLVGVGLWYGTSLFRGDGLDAPAAAPTPAFTPDAGPPAAVPLAGGQVALLAIAPVWVKVSDGGTQLFQKEMAAGERYDVPATAIAPTLEVGRPDKLQVLLNGSALPPLGDGRSALRDVPLTVAGLQARSQVTPVAAPSSTPTPAATSGSARASSASRSVPAAFRDPAPQPTPLSTRAQAAPASTGQRETPPAAATPGPVPTATPTSGAAGNTGG